MTRQHSSGFTLMEILVAVAILGILAAAAYPAYQNYLTRARVAEALEFADAARTRVDVALATGGQPAADLLDSAGKKVDMMSALTWAPGKPGEGLVGYILAEMDLPGIGLRKVLALEKRSNGEWHCVSAAPYAAANQALEADKLPASCRDGSATAMAKSAPAATSCAADQEQITTPDRTGKPQTVCAKRCATGQKRDPANAANCIADTPTASATASTNCPSGQVSWAGQGTSVCIPACPGGQVHDVSMKCCASGDLIALNGAQWCNPSAAPNAAPAAAPSTPAPATPAAAANSAVLAVKTKPSLSNNPCATGEVFIPDGKGPFTFDGTTPVPGRCVTKQDNVPDPYAPVQCTVCKVNPQLCFVLTKTMSCEWPKNICVSEITNKEDGSKWVDRRCGTHDEAVNDWWHATSDDPDCQDYKPDQNTLKAIHCTYACTTPNCNREVKPRQESLWVDRK